jgi:single-strand DNA-binding protein
MSAGLNQITIFGRLDNDPITRDTRTETTVTHFDVAVDESYKSKAGDKIEKVTWFRCEAWNGRGKAFSLLSRRESPSTSAKAIAFSSTVAWTSDNTTKRSVTGITRSSSKSPIPFSSSKTSKSSIGKTIISAMASIKMNCN